MQRIGIDAIALAVPAGYLKLADLAVARGVPSEKYTEGLLVTEMAVAAAHEDPVALAANAARRVLATSGRAAADIGLCVVGTETAVDHSKPIAAYIHGLLELPENCRTFETKHACFGGTAGFLGAIDWIASGAARGRAALVICSDVARYGIGTPGEPTQGAGAVAMIISANPRLLAIEVGVSGSFTSDVHDFWRPLNHKEALVDGHYSVNCYLDALSGAYRGWKQACAEEHLTDEPLARTCYHVPYGKMARKAHRHRMALEGLNDAAIEQSYQREVAPSLVLPSQVGNIYTGSLYLALASLLQQEAELIEGKRIGLFSYGSGCTAEFFSGWVVEGAAAFVRTLDLTAPLQHRRRYSMAEYETMRRSEDKADFAPLGTMQCPEGVVAFQGTDAERRVYWNGSEVRLPHATQPNSQQTTTPILSSRLTRPAQVRLSA